MKLNVGFALKEMGRLEEAQNLLAGAVEACVRVMGEDNPQTVGAMHALALCYQASENSEKAVALFRKVL